jgi:hypothetical protein
VIGGEISDNGFDQDEKSYARKAEWVPLDKVASLKFCNPIDSKKLIGDAIWIQNIYKSRTE